MFELFEHKADMGIRGIGKNIEEAFSEAAMAMLTIMYETKKIKPKKKIVVETYADSLDNLLVNFLNEILYQKDVSEISFCKAKVKEIKKIKDQYKLLAELLGEKKPNKKIFITEVKAATYSQLKVKEEDNYWIAECIVDV
ncbi:MAG: archease [Candidatus Diapherotrites archaeon]|nr:archease [Candidatus Diapherotrites archaeon]